jgi:hypothetical protein
MNSLSISQIVSDCAQLRTYCYIHEEEETTLVEKAFFFFPSKNSISKDRNTCKSTGKEKERP